LVHRVRPTSRSPSSDGAAARSTEGAPQRLREAASPAVLIFPSAGFGVGVPIQIVPDARPSVRLQGDLHFYPIGFVTSVDVYPRLGALPTLAEVSLLAQAAF
jgi:hypothetical protein